MSFGQPSWIAAHLLDDDAARRVVAVHSETVLYGTTAGPWRGIGGAALSNFQITLLVTDADVYVFADTALLGWASGPEESAAVLGAWADPAARTRQLPSLLRPPGTSPVQPVTR